MAGVERVDCRRDFLIETIEILVKEWLLNIKHGKHGKFNQVWLI